jgi:hypothetical protein
MTTEWLENPKIRAAVAITLGLHTAIHAPIAPHSLAVIVVSKRHDNDADTPQEGPEEQRLGIVSEATPPPPLMPFRQYDWHSHDYAAHMQAAFQASTDFMMRRNAALLDLRPTEQTS